jgi:hypothetical protein
MLPTPLPLLAKFPDGRPLLQVVITRHRGGIRLVGTDQPKRNRGPGDRIPMPGAGDTAELPRHTDLCHRLPGCYKPKLDIDPARFPGGWDLSDRGTSASVGESAVQ